MDDAGYGWRSFAGILVIIAGFFNAVDGLVVHGRPERRAQPGA